MYAVHATTKDECNALVQLLSVFDFETVQVSYLAKYRGDPNDAFGSDSSYKRVVCLWDEPPSRVVGATHAINRFSAEDGGTGRYVKVVILPARYCSDQRVALRNVSNLEILTCGSVDMVTHLAYSLLCMHNTNSTLRVRVHTMGDDDNEEEGGIIERGGVSGMHGILHQTLCHFSVNCTVSQSSRTCWIR
jgi:hypothetical protein